MHPSLLSCSELAELKREAIDDKAISHAEALATLRENNVEVQKIINKTLKQLVVVCSSARFE